LKLSLGRVKPLINEIGRDRVRRAGLLGRGQGTRGSQRLPTSAIAPVARLADLLGSNARLGLSYIPA
jgi:hypothetical protein